MHDEAGYCLSDRSCNRFVGFLASKVTGVSSMQSLPNIPKSVTIGGKRVSIKVLDMDSWGEYDHDLARICIATKATANNKLLRDTLRHELMHAALNISGVAFAETISEESVVRCLDEIFFPCWDKLELKLTK